MAVNGARANLVGKMTGILQVLVWWYTKAGGRLLAQPLEIGFYRRNLLRVILVPASFLFSILWPSGMQIGANGLGC